jgi:uncharacterized protein YrrD
LRTFSLLKGQPVFDQNNGLKIGEIFDLSMTKSGVVKGLLVKKGVLFKQIYFLSIDHIASFGCDGIMINGANQIEKLKTDPEYTFAHQHSLGGKMLISKSGDRLGLLQDVYFQEEMGTIVGYEVTDGFFSEISEGNLLIQTETPPMIGKDAIIIDVNNS